MAKKQIKKANKAERSPSMSANAATNARWEIERLQEVVGRYEGHVTRVRQWEFVLFTALFAAWLVYDKIESLHFGIAAVVLVAVFFFFVEVPLRGPLSNAIKRGRTIEEMLRRGTPYDGPNISDSLAMPVPYRTLLKESRMKHTWVFHAALTAIACVSALLAVVPPLAASSERPRTGTLAVITVHPQAYRATIPGQPGIEVSGSSIEAVKAKIRAALSDQGATARDVVFHELPSGSK